MNFKCSAVSGRGSKKKKAQKRKCSKNLSQRTMPEQYRAIKGEELCILYCLQFPPDLGAAVPTVAGDGRG